MNPFFQVIYIIVVLLSLSIFTVRALQSCDFCPEPATLETDDAYCNELLRLSRIGNLYKSQEECDFNLPILAQRCGCTIPGGAGRHAPCDPCATTTSTDNIYSDSKHNQSMTILNPRGRVSLLDLGSDYPCIEMLYAARNGGLNPKNCHTVSTSEIDTACSGCVPTEICDFDEVVCPTNQILVATNPKDHPGISNIWSTALMCQDLIESARKGELVSDSGCITLKSSVKAAFQPGTFGVGVFDLTPCGLQCNDIDIDTDTESEGTSYISMGRTNTGAPDRYSDASGRLEGQPSQPTTTPPNPTHKPTEETTVEPSQQPSDGPSLSASQQPSDGPSLSANQRPSDGPSILATEFPIASSSPRIKSPTREFENCQLCDFENDSIFYLYKDFGISGTTFFEALSAPGHRDREECYEHENEHICIPKEPLHPDLDGCYLTDVTTFDELIGIQAVIPPNKAAYIGVFKDTMEVHTEAKECDQFSPTIGNNNICKVENYRQNLVYGHSARKDTEDIENSIDVYEGSDQNLCPALKEGWFNYGKASAVPSNLWKNDQPSYCNVGPIQNAAAVWPVHPNGSNYGDMRDVNAGWQLTGAVYKCCKSLQTCTVSIAY